MAILRVGSSSSRPLYHSVAAGGLPLAVHCRETVSPAVTKTKSLSRKTDGGTVEDKSGKTLTQAHDKSSFFFLSQKSNFKILIDQKDLFPPTKSKLSFPDCKGKTWLNHRKPKDIISEVAVF